VRLKRVVETTVEAGRPELLAQAEALLALVGSRVDDGTVLVVVRGGEVLGASVVRVCGLDADLLALNHRHRGIGRRLVVESVRRARIAGCRRLRVRLPKTLDGLATFFAHLGFEETQLALDLEL